jgi:AcrR family transcriptional regulator
MRRAALLDAARALLAERGVPGLTFPALAERTGLARSSVYEYFPSRAALVEELCATDFPLWAAEIEAAMAAAGTPREKIEAYVRHQVALATDHRHRALVALRSGDPAQDARKGAEPDVARERIRAAHAGLSELVVEVLRDVGHADPSLVAALMQGIVDAAVRRATPPSARSADAVADSAVALALDGVTGLLGQRDALGGQQPGGPAA